MFSSMNLRLLALSGVVALTVALPLTVASAGPVGDADRDALLSLMPEAGPQETPEESPEKGPQDGKVREAADPSADSPLLLGLGLATAARCGPELTSPDGIEAQTCVLSQGRRPGRAPTTATRPATN